MREGILPLNSHTWAGILSTTHEKVTKGPLAPPQLDLFLSTAKRDGGQRDPWLEA
jgi:hypothetical protein